MNAAEQSQENTEATETPDVIEVDPAVEAEAYRQGWNKNYQGEGKMDAATYLAKGKEINSILKYNNARLQRDLDTAKVELKELKLTTAEFAKEFATMKDNAYKRAIADLKSQRRDAIKEDDLETADDLEERIDVLKEEQAKKAAVPAQQAKPEPDMTAFNDWHRDNKWYDESSEPDMFDAAEAAALRLSRTDKSLTGRAFMDKVTEIVKGKFPDRFENQRRKSSPHEGGGARGESKNVHSYASLPADAKQKCDKFVKEGIMTKEAYVAAYEWED